MDKKEQGKNAKVYIDKIVAIYSPIGPQKDISYNMAAI